MLNLVLDARGEFWSPISTSLFGLNSLRIRQVSISGSIWALSIITVSKILFGASSFVYVSSSDLMSCCIPPWDPNSSWTLVITILELTKRYYLIVGRTYCLKSLNPFTSCISSYDNLMSYSSIVIITSLCLDSNCLTSIFSMSRSGNY